MEYQGTASADGGHPPGRGPCCPGEGVLPGWLEPPKYFIQPPPESRGTDEGLVLHAQVRMLARFAEEGLVLCAGKIVEAWMRADEHKDAVQVELTMAMDQDDGLPPELGRVIWTRDSCEPPEPGAVNWDRRDLSGHYWFVPPSQAASR